MPRPEQILDGLKKTANNWQVLAIIWHIYFAGLALSLPLGWRPSKRLAGTLLGLPLLSVSILAWVSANPFNGMFFGLAGIVLIFISMKLPRKNVRIAPIWSVVVGTLMFIFGWVYPHFLNTSSLVLYLYAAPVGLIPCPTLSTVIGLAFVLGGLESRSWSIVLGATGVFYGAFGAVYLGVTIDWILLLGSLIILLTVFLDLRRGE